MGIIKYIQDKIESKMTDSRNKKLIAKFKAMTDDELLDFIAKKERAVVVKGDTEEKATVAKALEQIEESEKQLEILTETDIGSKLTGPQKTAIAKTIDSETLLKQAGKDFIDELPKEDSYDIVRRVITNQEVRLNNMNFQELEKSVNGIYRMVNYANDWKTLRYIVVAKSRIQELLDMPVTTGNKDLEEDLSLEEQRRQQAQAINRKLLAIAAKKVIANYRQSGINMRITEFINVSIPLDELNDLAGIDTSDPAIAEKLKQYQKNYFLEQVEKESSEEVRQEIERELRDEEERIQRGKLAKLKRDAGEQTVQQIADIAQNTELLNNPNPPEGDGRED